MFLGVLLIVAVFVLQGCFPAIIAVTGANVAKTIQGETGGSVKVVLASPTMESQSDLSEMKIAVWPAGNRGVKIAEALSESNYEVVTPNEVINSLGDRKLDYLTFTEKMKLYRKVGNLLNVDTILVYTEGKPMQEKNSLSIKRSQAITVFVLEAWHAKTGKMFWEQRGRIILNKGGSTPSQDEIDRVLVRTLSERFFPPIKVAIVSQKTRNEKK